MCIIQERHLADKCSILINDKAVLHHPPFLSSMDHEYGNVYVININLFLCIFIRVNNKVNAATGQIATSAFCFYGICMGRRTQNN